MRLRLRSILIAGLAMLSVGTLFAQEKNDKLLTILREELTQQMKELQKGEFPPYQMNYRVIDKTVSQVSTSFGSLTASIHTRSVRFVPQIRVGSYEFDNFKNRHMGAGYNRNGALSSAALPLNVEGGEAAIRQAIWNETNNRYQFALSVFRNDLANKSVNVASDDKAPCFSDAEVEKYYEEALPEEKCKLDLDEWAEKLKKVSAVFDKDKKILSGSASITYTVERRYFIDTEGREVVQNLTYARVMVNAQTKADDGMELPLYLSYFAYEPQNLPSVEKMVSDADAMADKVLALREAPIVDPYTGPAILSGAASGVFFHEIFGHRIEGQRMKSDRDGQTFKKLVGQYVLPKTMNVYDDPTLKSYNGEDLNGYYKFDDQGIRGERVHAVKDGKLQDFLMTRTPIDNFPRSNGHARGMDGFDPVSRQSNLLIESSENLTEEDLRKLLIEEVKKQGKEYGYYFKSVTGGLTMTSVGQTNSFSVNPVEVYKVFVDGRPDQLVRGVDLIGTPLSMFSNIIHAGGDSEVFTGMCGAESGSIPVTAISPTILVNKVEMQRKAKSNELPPILERP